MSSLAVTALSGLQAAQTRLQVSANNVANAQTEGFQREVVQQQANPNGGVSTRVEKLPEPGADLATDLVEQKMAAYSFQANLKVLKTDEAMTGSLLNTQA